MPTRAHIVALVSLALLCAAMPTRVRAQVNVRPAELDDVAVVEHLDGQLPLDAMLRDHTGRAVRLGSFFHSGRPVLLNLAYYTCPVLCSMVADATVRGLRDVQWTVGREFDVVTLSIDPRDTPRAAKSKREHLLGLYGRPEARRGWHVLVGDDNTVSAIAAAVGFRYRYDERQGQYAHPAAIVLVKPNGRVGRYLYGLEYRPADLRMGLLDVSEGKSISSVEHFLLYCYRYDPQGSKYVLVAQNVMKVGGALTAALLALFLGVLWWREIRRRRDPPAPTPPSQDSMSQELGAPR